MSSYKNKSNYVINRNLLVSSKRKRLRHVDYILARNLDVSSSLDDNTDRRPATLASGVNQYSVWFTLHLTRASKAVYISEKKYNTPNPKWNKITFDDDLASSSNRHLASKEFLVRIWFKSESVDSSSSSKVVIKQPASSPSPSLRLLIEYEINLESVVQVNEEALNLPNVDFKNIIIVEMLDTAFSQPPPASAVISAQPAASQRPASVVGPRHHKTASWTGSARGERENVVKSSYTLNSMLRINDFQRIVCESSLKIHQLKQASLAKYESTERQRELLVRKEAQLKRIQLYREQLANVKKSISRLSIQNDAIDLSMEKQKRLIRDQNEEQKAKLKKLNDSIHSLMVRSANLNLKLKLRQKSLLNELISVFQLDTLFKSQSVQAQQDSHINLINAILRTKSSTSTSSSSKVSQSALSMSNQIAIQLGYICHIIKMLTVILNIQLRYPVIFRASMSYIMEYEAQLASSNTATQSENNSNALNSAATTSTEFYQFIKEYPLFKPNSSSSNKNKSASGSPLQEDISLYAIQLLNRDLLQLRIFLNNNRKSLQAQHQNPQQPPSLSNNPPAAKVNFRSLSINDLLSNLRLVFESF